MSMLESGNTAGTRTQLGVLLFTDIVGSMQLKGVVGPGEYVRLLGRHNEIFEEGIAGVEGGRIVKHMGDGYFAAFSTASAAVRFALVFQSRIGLEPWGAHRLETRVGIHVGEMVLKKMAGQADIVGLTADLAARIMGLAVGRQILMTAQAFNDARQFVNSPPRELEGMPPLKWMAHGRYVFKGNDEALEIFEVGIEKVSPLRPPDNSEKAKRAVPHDEEHTLGWRPAAGLEIPGRSAWALERKLGEGGFGEVWLAIHIKLKHERVFKFCFDPERLRSFKRELTLFRVLREALGDRKDIAQLFEVKLDEAPFYLESEYTPSGSLADWVVRNADRGGLNKLTLDQRITLVANVAEAVAAAHSVGVLHKDIKPSNILIEEEPAGSLNPKLADFGIGVLADKSVLRAKNITEAGMTLVEDNDSSRTGTRMYSPPETLEGKVFTLQGDVYALGVLLYQMVVGDLSRPLGMGWEREISDPMLRDDIAVCVDRELTRRLTGARELASRLQCLGERRTMAVLDARAKAIRGRNRRNRRIAGVTAVVFALLFGTGLAVTVRKNRELDSKNSELALANDRISEEKAEAQKQAGIAKAVATFQTDMLATADPNNLFGDKVTVVQAMTAAISELDAGKLKDQPIVEAAVCDSIGNTLMSLGRYVEAEPVLRKSLLLRRKSFGAGHPDIVTSLDSVSALLYAVSKFDEAEPLAREALKISRKNLPAEHSRIGVSLVNLATILMAQNKLDDAEPLFKEALRIFRKSNPPAPYYTGATLTNLTELLRVQNRLAEAEALGREALEMFRRCLPGKHPKTAACLNNLALILQSQGRLDEAERLCREALVMRQSVLPIGHVEIAVSLHNLAFILQFQGKLTDAEPLYREALVIRRKALPAMHPDLTTTLNNLGELLRVQNRLGEAEPLLRESLESWRKFPPTGHPTFAINLSNFASLLLAEDKFAEAEPLYREALDIYRRAGESSRADAVALAAQVGGCLNALGRFEDAIPYIREALEGRESLYGLTDTRTCRSAFFLAQALIRLNRLEEANAVHMRYRLGDPATRTSNRP